MLTIPPYTGNPELDAFLFDLAMNGSGVGSGSGLSTNTTTGEITDPSSGTVISYLYKYMHIKYADDNQGLNISDSPTNKAFFGLYNSDSATESTTPADYTWYEATGGFGTTKFLWYVSTGGRQFKYNVGINGSTFTYIKDSGTPVDLDVVTGSSGSSARICYAKATVTVLSSTPASMTTIGSTSFPPTNTWGGGETWVATPYTLGTGEALFQCDGIYNPQTGLTTWNSPYLSNLKVGSLSAISADMGTLTAGTIRLPATGSTYLIIDGANNRIDVYNAGVLRVRLGNLA